MSALEDLWSRGSYPEIAVNYLSMAGELVALSGVEEGDAVLDVGCGTGTVAITAARRGAQVTGVDVTPEMLEEARRNAEIAGVDDVTWREGDAADLPFTDDAFDVTLSNLGHMYADPPGAAADELRRVTRPGGRVGFTAWTPTSAYPALAGVLSTYLDPGDLPEFSEPPFMWGDVDVVADRLGPSVEVDTATDTVSYPALSPGHFWRETAAHSGVFGEYLEKVDEAQRDALREQLTETIARHFDADENAVTLTYLRTQATVPG